MTVETSEHELVRRLRCGDEEAYRAVLETHGGRLLAVARRMVGETDAPDALQDAMLHAFRKIESFRGEASFATWLHRITVNACLMRLRKRRATPEESIEELLPTFSETGHRVATHLDATGQPIDITATWAALPEDEVARQELAELVRRCVSRLPDVYRVVFLMRDVEGFGGNEVADVLGVTHNAVKIRLHRARQALRTLIENELRGSQIWS